MVSQTTDHYLPGLFQSVVKLDFKILIQQSRANHLINGIFLYLLVDLHTILLTCVQVMDLVLGGTYPYLLHINLYIYININKYK